MEITWDDWLIVSLNNVQIKLSTCKKTLTQMMRIRKIYMLRNIAVVGMSKNEEKAGSIMYKST